MDQWYIISEEKKTARRQRWLFGIKLMLLDHEWVNNDNKITKMVIKHVGIFWLADVILKNSNRTWGI